jgi:hypothetical protein
LCTSFIYSNPAVPIPMLDLVDIGVALGFGVLGAVGVVFVNDVLKMFKGDIMEQLFRFMVAGFILITLVGFGDAALLAGGVTVPSGVFGAVLMVSFALLLIGLVRLIQWNEKSKLSVVAA